LRKNLDTIGFVSTVHQIAEELNILEHEAKVALEQLEKSGRINITDIPRETTIQFVD